MASSSSESSPAVISVKNKMQYIKDDLSRYKEFYAQTVKQLEDNSQKREQYQVDVKALRQKVQQMEKEYEQLSAQLQEATDKLVNVTKYADECERARRALDHRKNMDEDRIAILEQMLKETNDALMESEKKFEEVSRKLLVTKADEERAEARTQVAETKAKGILDEIRTLTSKLKGFQCELETFAEREEKYDHTISDLKARIKNSENHSNETDEGIEKLQKEIHHLRDQLAQSRVEYQSLTKELVHA